MRTMRQVRVALLRPLLRHLTCPQTAGRGRVLHRDLCQRSGYLDRTRQFPVRWLSTLGVAELDHARSSRPPREIQPDVQHASVNQYFEHGYDTLLSYPGGISTDLEGELVFISDTSHDRIIITDANGKVLDYIGSVAGFEDGSFESGQLQRPTSTFFDPEQNCLYIADCENHAIRRADLISRTLHTVYPVQEEFVRPGFVQRWLHWLGLKKDSVLEGEGDTEEDQQHLAYPWHLAMTPSGHVLAATQGFEKMWTIDVGRGEATIDPDQEPDAVFKKFMGFKSAEIRDIQLDWVHVHETLLSKGLARDSFSNLASQVATLKHQVFVLDPEMHQVLKMDLIAGHVSTMQLSNLGLLGLPAWWSTPVSLQFPSSPSSTKKLEEFQHQSRDQEPVAVFQVQPGRCLICVDVALPRGTILAEPVDEDCLWRQGRGSLVELSVFGGELTNHKVSAAQQYLDDLHTLEGADEIMMEDTTEEDLPVPKQSPSGLPFYSSVDVSLGTGEVVFDAVLYLKRNSSAGSEITPDRSESLSATGPSHSRTRSPLNRKLKDFPNGAIMVKHLHLRVRFEASEDALLTRMVLLDVQL